MTDSKPKTNIPKEKSQLHPRNKHKDGYDFNKLTETSPGLAKYIKVNEHGTESVDFANPKAVKWLNKALLKQFYLIGDWDIPAGYLCPPIPGRADYIHHIADLLGASNGGKIPKGENVRCMDIGVGASCVYPAIGHKEYGWSFIGADIDAVALESARNIVDNNPTLRQHVELRLQQNPRDIFHGIMQRSEPVDLTICNPPFHASMEEAQKGTLRKLSSLGGKKVTEPVLNFGGQSNELWCPGGEVRFILDMIRQSRQFADNCFWFSTLLSKQSHLQVITDAIKSAGAADIKVIPMGQGTKVTRIVAWTFLNAARQKKWVETRWNLM